MTRSEHNPWLHRFALLTAAATLALIAIGGLVTSHGVGMAVPDWPTTYGYNMFLFPISLWEGGVFYEHSHRLLASGVGLLTTVLAIWLWLKDSRSWLRWFGVWAFVLVCLQGVMGGLRVTLIKDELGIFHAMLAQAFFVIVGLIALFTSRGWPELRNRGALPPAHVQNWVLASVALILLQLGIGATMRHQHAGLAVPDFPLAYGKLWPPTDTASLELANQRRTDYRDFNLITSFQVILHMSHRIGALLALAAVAVAARNIFRFSHGPLVRRLAVAWVSLLVLQGALGAVTVWSNKAADVATAHVVVGALSLLMGVLLYAAVRATAGVNQPVRDQWQKAIAPLVRGHQT